MANRSEKFKPIARVLVKTGLRRDLCANMLGISTYALTDWIKQGRWPVSQSFCTKGMHIGAESFIRHRFKALTGYLFYLMHVRAGKYIQDQFMCRDERVARTLQFTVSQRLFAEVLERYLASFTHPTAEKQITPSQSSFFVTYISARLIRVGTCDTCGITAPEQLQLWKTTPGYFCRCHKLARGKAYWDRFNGVMFNDLFPKVDAGEIAGHPRIEEELESILREIALDAVCLTKKPA